MNDSRRDAEEETVTEHQQDATTTPADKSDRQTTAAAEDTATGSCTVDPFDVSNVVTAMTSGKPIFEALPSDGSQRSSSAGKQQMTAQERRERDRQITAALIGAEDDNEAAGARTRPRPRPQASAVPSANPFKISLAATNIEPTSVDDEDAYDADEDSYQQKSNITFSAANPFARAADLDFDEAVKIDSGVWDPFSGDDATTFTATFDLDLDHDKDDVTNYQLTSKGSRSHEQGQSLAVQEFSGGAAGRTAGAARTLLPGLGRQDRLDHVPPHSSEEEADAEPCVEGGVRATV